ITGVDLVREQITVAHGERLTLRQDKIRFEGHAIECRINAEDPHSHVPSPGHISTYHPPGGPGVRIDSALYAGYKVPPHYDSMIAKLIIHDTERSRALGRMGRSLGECVIEGIKTNVPLHRAVLRAPDMLSGHYDTGWLARFLTTWEN
ncbi:MAG: acetyl-CoA carboxylase biotin carboxylase subunit, partial [Pseudomonadota bacterium]